MTKNDLKYIFGWTASGAIIPAALLVTPGEKSPAEIAMAVGMGAAYTVGMLTLNHFASKPQKIAVNPKP